ncbi:MAG: methylthioribulose 1-phosphate dehydratase [Cyanobacteria bacterium]|nr:methylthioribulose 1-phosphate dehydratase [Cyanobacteriota bacterium]
MGRATNLQTKEIQERIDLAIVELQQLGAFYHQRGWCLGTSGNFSVVVEREPLLVLVTASGKDKSRLSREDFTLVNEQGLTVSSSLSGKPSAETLLHLTVARQRNVGAVLHTHSVWSTILSEKHFESNYLEIAGFEMLKGLDGVTTHETSVHLPILENTQSMPELAARVTTRLAHDSENMQHGYLIRKHGMHTWGKTLADAKRHVEILEFLLEAVGRLEGGR